MISIDQMLFDFVQQNYITCTMILGLLKMLAHETETTSDDKIITLLMNLFRKHKK